MFCFKWCLKHVHIDYWFRSYMHIINLKSTTTWKTVNMLGPLRVNDNLLPSFNYMKPKLPEWCNVFSIRKPIFHIPVIRHEFAKQLIEYKLLKLLNTVSGTLLISSKVHTHSFIGIKIYIKNREWEFNGTSMHLLDGYISANQWFVLHSWVRSRSIIGFPWDSIPRSLGHWFL